MKRWTSATTVYHNVISVLQNAVYTGAWPTLNGGVHTAKAGFGLSGRPGRVREVLCSTYAPTAWSPSLPRS